MKAHRTDGVSLMFALLFAAFVIWWLLLGRVDVKLPALGWLVAGALILFGLLGLAGALRANRAHHEQPQPEPAPVSESAVSAPPASDPGPMPSDDATGETPTVVQPAVDEVNHGDR